MLEELDGVGSLESFAVGIFFAPCFIQIQRLDDLAQHLLILHDFKFGLDEIGIITRGGSLTAHAADVRDGVRLDFNPRRAGIRRRQNERDRRGDDGGNQKNRDDDRLANPDDAPIIQEVQLGFRLRLIFLQIHMSKNNGSRSKDPAPG